MESEMDRAERRKREKAVRNGEVGWMEIGSREWVIAWELMAQVSGDDDFRAFDIGSGEVWQYLGSLRRDGEWRHEFRHRWHPRLRERWVIRVPASPNWAPALAPPKH
ncbi:MAG: hypothetical protein U0228_29915 [Myxococcaceae bacterium]